MIFRKYLKSDDYKMILGIGQFLLTLSVLGLLISTSRILNMLITNESWLNFTEGFFFGLSISILVLSAIFNIKGLILLKKSHSGDNPHG